MKIAHNCKCKLSVELEMIPNGNIVNNIGTIIPSYITRHATLLCPIKRHRTTTRMQITPEYVSINKGLR